MLLCKALFYTCARHSDVGHLIRRTSYKHAQRRLCSMRCSLQQMYILMKQWLKGWIHYFTSQFSSIAFISICGRHVWKARWRSRCLVTKVWKCTTKRKLTQHTLNATYVKMMMSFVARAPSRQGHDGKHKPSLTLWLSPSVSQDCQSQRPQGFLTLQEQASFQAVKFLTVLELDSGSSQGQTKCFPEDS